MQTIYFLSRWIRAFNFVNVRIFKDSDFWRLEFSLKQFFICICERVVPLIDTNYLFHMILRIPSRNYTCKWMFSKCFMFWSHIEYYYLYFLSSNKTVGTFWGACWRSRAKLFLYHTYIFEKDTILYISISVISHIHLAI